MKLRTAALAFAVLAATVPNLATTAQARPFGIGHAGYGGWGYGGWGRGWGWGGMGVGLATGALVGAALAAPGPYYDSWYYPYGYAPAYGYAAPAYGYAPAYAPAYGYGYAPAYPAPYWGGY
jgi:hypothetical protein